MNNGNDAAEQLIADLQEAATGAIRRPHIWVLIVAAILVALPVGTIMIVRLAERVLPDLLPGLLPENAPADRDLQAPLAGVVLKMVASGVAMGAFLIFLIHAWEADGETRWVWPML